MEKNRRDKKLPPYENSLSVVIVLIKFWSYYAYVIIIWNILVDFFLIFGVVFLQIWMSVLISKLHYNSSEIRNDAFKFKSIET